MVVPLSDVPDGRDENELYCPAIFICAANCYFNSAWRTACASNQTCGAIGIGPDAKKKGTGLTPIVAQFNQGLFSSAVTYDVYFDTDAATGRYCHCRVALGDGMIDVATQPRRRHRGSTRRP